MRALRDETADVVTDRIETSTDNGVLRRPAARARAELRRNPTSSVGGKVAVAA